MLKQTEQEKFSWKKFMNLFLNKPKTQEKETFKILKWNTNDKGQINVNPKKWDHICLFSNAYV